MLMASKTEHPIKTLAVMRRGHLVTVPKQYLLYKVLIYITVILMYVFAWFLYFVRNGNYGSIQILSR